LILDWYPLRRIELSPRTWLRQAGGIALLEKIPFFVVALGLLLNRIDRPRQSSIGWSQWSSTARQRGFVQSFYGLMFYVQKTIWPLELAAAL
jgi:hypothetical protein